MSIDSTRNELEKRFGKGITMMGNERVDVPIICSSGSVKLDAAIGVGGIPEGRIIEVYGPEASGKTTTTLSIIKEAQKAGKACAFIDAEHALDPVWASNIGVDMNKLLVSQPDCGEDALEVVEALVKSNEFGIVGIDSVAALVPRAELNGEMGDSHMGLHARLMSQAMRKLTGIISKSKCTVIFINQIRMKIGVSFGNPETTTGGEALKFYASIRLEVRRQLGSSEKNDKEGMTQAAITIKVVKNKVAPPYKKVELALNTGKDNLFGYDTASEILGLAVDQELIEKAGNTYSYNEEKLGVGKGNASDFLRHNLNLVEELKIKIMSKIIEDNKPVIGSFADVQAKQELENPDASLEKPERKRKKKVLKEEE